MNFLTVLGAGSPRSRCQQGCFPVGGLSCRRLVDGCLLTVSSHGLPIVLTQGLAWQGDEEGDKERGSVLQRRFLSSSSFFLPFLKRIAVPGPPWWSSGWEPAFPCRGRGFDPWLGNHDCTCHRATKPAHSKEKPLWGNRRPQAPQLEKPCAPQQRPSAAKNFY